MADYIPFEVQAEIMKRLPTKSLMQFRSVSKQWKSLIDSPEFIADYSFNHTHEHHLLVSYIVAANPEQKYVSFVGDDTFPLEKVSLPVPIPGLIKPIVLGSRTSNAIPRILGSYQGLFCLYNISIEPREPRRILRTVHLWNPSIRKSIAIDVSHVAIPNSSMLIGFGVCPHTSHPKLVKINSSRRLPGVETISSFEVYTLSSRAWRSIPTINQPRKSLCLLGNQVVISEFIYWFAIDGDDTHGYNVIVSFDLTSEGFIEVSLPDTLACAHSENVVVSKLKESLVVVEVVDEANKRVYVVWMMEHGVSNLFSKLFTINIPHLSIQALLGFWKNNEPIIAMRTDFDADDVFVHELQSECISYLGISGYGFNYCANSYMETLLLLDH